MLTDYPEATGHERRTPATSSDVCHPVEIMGLEYSKSSGSDAPLALGTETVPSTIQHAEEFIDLVENVELALHWLDEHGVILWANPAHLNLLGYSREEVLGRNIVDFHEDKAAISDVLRRLKANEPIRNYPVVLRRRDGSLCYAAVDCSVFRKDGRFVHSRCATRDLTKERQAAETQERLAAIVESSDDAIISKDLNGVIQSWNRGAESLFGYTAREMIGQHISKIAAPDVVDEIPAILDRLRRGERVDHYQTKRRTKDGRILTVSLTVSPIRDSSGTIIGASKVGRDITERALHEKALQEANDALERSNADLEQFAYSASHDLQEPLRIVVAYSELLKMEFGDQLGSTGQQYIGFVVESALRMEQLLTDLRVYMQASTSEPRPSEAVNADLALDGALKNLERLIDENGAIVIRSHLPEVRVQEFQLEQLFQNLIGNAIRYRSSEVPRVEVSASRDGKGWRFCVRDNGIGIDPQYKEQIFGIFKRLHTKGEYPGTGMGLAICQRIVDRLGGRIWVESALGKGSTFCFTIPS